MPKEIDLEYLITAASDDPDPPTISTATWAAALPANDLTIRAAMLTCRGDRDGRAMLYRQDKRQMFVRRQKKGWLIELAWDGQRRDKVAVKPDKARRKHVVPWSSWKTFLVKWPGDIFGSEVAEQLLLNFVKSESEITGVAWLTLDWKTGR